MMAGNGIGDQFGDAPVTSHCQTENTGGTRSRVIDTHVLARKTFLEDTAVLSKVVEQAGKSARFPAAEDNSRSTRQRTETIQVPAEHLPITGVGIVAV